MNPSGLRTLLIVPLRQQGELVGTLAAHRTEVRPFTDRQIKLLETFADQAVIAIENVRLFQELKESLEQQTATSEILGVIANSPTDIQPVLDTIAENAARVCESDDATFDLSSEGHIVRWQTTGRFPHIRLGLSLPISSSANEAILDRRTIHVPDVLAEAKTIPG